MRASRAQVTVELASSSRLVPKAESGGRAGREAQASGAEPP